MVCIALKEIPGLVAESFAFVQGKKKKELVLDFSGGFPEVGLMLMRRGMCRLHDVNSGDATFTHKDKILSSSSMVSSPVMLFEHLCRVPFFR